MDRMSLRDYQALFTQMVLNETVPERLAKQVIPGGALSVSEALHVYARGYQARLTEALGETFEAIWWVLGDDGFFTLAKRYFQSYPSQTYTLSDIGKDLPHYLLNYPETEDFPFLPDLARFEWIFHELFHTKPHPSISTQDVHRLLSTGHVRLELGAATALIESPFSICDIWKRKNTDPDDRSPLSWDRPQRLLLYKHHKRIMIQELDVVGMMVLRRLNEGHSIEQALTDLATTEQEPTEDQVRTLFELMFHTGIIQNIHPIDLPAPDCLNVSPASH